MNYFREAGIVLVVDRSRLAVTHDDSFVRGYPEAIISVELDQVGIGLVERIVVSHVGFLARRGDFQETGVGRKPGPE